MSSESSHPGNQMKVLTAKEKKKKEGSSASSKSLSETENLPETILDEKVALLVQFLLHNHQIYESITKADVTDVVIKDYRDYFPEILRKASKHMELVFGVDVEEMEPTSHSYILVNKLNLTYDSRLSSDGGVPKTGILIIVLGLIFMKGIYGTEEDIWEMLNMMGSYSGSNHFLSGEPRKLITKDLVREKYLDYCQVPNSDPPCYVFLWGPRAHAEASKMKLLEFFSFSFSLSFFFFFTKIHKFDSICFPSQYEETLRDEAERAHATATSRAGTTTMARKSSSARSISSSCP
ncbi:melanoma-associated antigen B16-like [Molossus nigricans]